MHVPPASADLCTTVQSTSANRTEQYTAVRDCRGTPVVIVSYWLCMSHVIIIKESLITMHMLSQREEVIYYVR